MTTSQGEEATIRSLPAVHSAEPDKKIEFMVNQVAVLILLSPPTIAAARFLVSLAMAIPFI